METEIEQQRNRKLFRKKWMNEWSEENEDESRSQYGANANR